MQLHYPRRQGAMRNLLMAVALSACTPSLWAVTPANQITVLVCKGWMPLYDDWALPRNRENSTDPTRFTIVLNLAERRIETTLPHAGKLNAPLEVTDLVYSASVSTPGSRIGSAPIKGVSIVLNRFTTEASLSYVRESDEAMLIAFGGTCAPGVPQF